MPYAGDYDQIRRNIRITEIDFGPNGLDCGRMINSREVYSVSGAPARRPKRRVSIFTVICIYVYVFLGPLLL